MTDPIRFQKLSEVFEAARALRGDDRDAYLRQTCADDAALLAEVQRLLDHHEEDVAPLAEPVAPGLASAAIRAAAQSNDAPLPERIAHYRVKRQIGVGGMGVVYLAEQERPQREVAIKVIRPGVVTAQLLKRFDMEAAMLGRLQHPGIAQIYEAGTFDDGAGERPYFAMEYIDGSPLLEFARERGLDTRARLTLFSQVCEAVHHAHQRGVIHRDLKPGNVLVDSSGQPRILDFGVARATDSDLQVTSLDTNVGQLIGTLAYMSPEQVLGHVGDIDTRSDVYALGVMLFELLTDRLPYDLQNRVIAAAARVISEDEPTSLTSINKIYRGDLDTIVHKALEKTPERRYQSASDFAADVHRFLHLEPIVARPATTLYQLSKFARRNKALVSGIAATFVALLAGVAGTTTFAVGKTRALAESESQRRIATGVNDFLTQDLIEQMDPEVESDREITLMQALDRAVGRIETRFGGAPLVEAYLRMTIGKAYRNLHRLDDADVQLDLALELYRNALGPDAPDTLLCEMENLVVGIDRGEFATTEPKLRALLERQRSRLGDDHVQTMASLNNLGSALFGQGRFSDAEPLLAEALEGRTRVLGEQSEHTATTMSNLGALYVYTGRFERAAELMPAALDTLKATSGSRHPQTLRTMANLGVVYHRLKQIDDAVATLEEAMPLHREVLGPNHRATLQVTSTLAALYGIQGNHDQRKVLLNQALEAQRATLGEDHLDTLVTRMNLAKVAYDQEDYKAAEPEYADIAFRIKANYPDHFLGAIVRTMQARCFLELGQYEQAESAFMTAYNDMVRMMGKRHDHTLEIARSLADLYTRWQRPDDAAQWRNTASPQNAQDGGGSG